VRHAGDESGMADVRDIPVAERANEPIGAKVANTSQEVESGDTDGAVSVE